MPTSFVIKNARRISLAGIIALLSVLVIGVAPARAAGGGKVSAWLPYWDQQAALDSFVANAAQYDQVSPFWYHLSASGAILSWENAGNATVIQTVKGAGVSLIPTIGNEFDGSIVSQMMASPAARAAHIAALTNLAVTKGYDGIDIDYENLPASDRSAFTAFVRDLAASLHGAGKVLSVTVHPKTSEPGNWNGPQAQDYAAIGAVADRVRVMAYDYHWNTSDAGAISPAGWVDDVARFTASVVDPRKVQLGLPLYGYDWVGRNGTGVTYTQVQALIARYRPVVNWSETDGESWFTYSEGGTTHTVWFSDARSTAVKLRSVSRYNLAGVVFWRLGNEDASVWSATSEAFGGGTGGGTPPPPPPPPPAEDTTAPWVAILDPRPNSKIRSITQIMTWEARDDTGIASIELYVDGVLIATPSDPNGSYVLQTGSWDRGRHLLTVVVKDAAGNRSAANAYVRI